MTARHHSASHVDNHVDNHTAATPAHSTPHPAAAPVALQHSSLVCPPEELVWRQRQAASLMATVASAVAGHTLNLLDHWQACLVLTDRDGVVLASYGHQQLLGNDAALLHPGARWREESLGHNAIAETLNAPRANRLARIALEAHDAECLKGLASASAALLAPASWSASRGLTPGACEGCLGLICDPYRVRQYSLGMLGVLADDIEQRRLGEAHGHDHHLLRLHLNRSQLDSPSAALLAITPQGQVAAASRRGLQLLAAHLELTPASENAANASNSTAHAADSDSCATRDDIHLLLGQPLARWQLDWAPLAQLAEAQCVTLTQHPRFTGYTLCAAPPRPRVVPRAPAKHPESQPPAETAARETACHPSLARLHHGDAGWARVCELLTRLVNARLPLLLQGETGVGKEEVVKALHQASHRAHQPLVAINCAALPDELVEAELFGYRRGAFTGADPAGREGRLLEANGGRLFLDEIGDMPLHVQARLLRVLQEREVTPLGGGKPQRVDFELVAATHQPLSELVKAGRFRADLYYRLCGASIALPPLRERHDIAGLSRALLTRLCRVQQRELPRLTPAFLDRLTQHDWPGNVRELDNVLRLALALCDGPTLEPAHVMLAGDCLASQGDCLAVEGDCPAAEGEIAHQPSQPSSLPSLHDLSSAEELQSALDALGGNVSRLARELGISRTTLYKRLGAA
ncbi:sigma-54-dependent Fis family transcriptional regulator [Cobetia amphilecti]|uniref:sigma-54-dependent Fis family transcriptional regulator n=1 Tax=Cobetia amphilecti TaxID=1055104 RepID=UPI001C08EE86|nr:sigma 54-interacting transcriptional regulator [Cobetia amphilecti]MBU3006787.1 sigma 54-interacting transcriptional regulator [Cobetia amphilecti]